MCKKTRASSFIFMSFLFNPSLILKSFTYCSRSKIQCFVVYQDEQPLFVFCGVSERTTIISVFCGVSERTTIISICSINFFYFCNQDDVYCAVRIESQYVLIEIYRGAYKSLAPPTSRCSLFDDENISFDVSLLYIYIYIYIYIYSTNFLQLCL